MSISSVLGRSVLHVRRWPWIKRLKHLIPEHMKQWAWRMAVDQDEFVIAGNRMRIPVGDRNAIYLSDEYEPEITAKLQQLLKPGMTFCDVGANMGVLTLFAARLVGPTGRVFAFEPFPKNAAVVRENVALNGFTNVTVVEAAVSETNGEALLHLSEYCGSHCLAENPGASAGKTLPVKTIRLDSVPGLDRIDVLKSDTEGTELAVLRGLGSLQPSHIIVEANTYLFTVMGKPSKDFTGPGFLSALDSLGYEVIENLTAPDSGVEPIKREVDGLWNLLLRPRARGAQ
ncbi:MAG: FkbM family methyltransferase [Verrucomicrobiaceae bacterium]|nr:MAG: FkbM family methyltransferase [Verrucomicrobiaceae bacterium]